MKRWILSGLAAVGTCVPAVTAAAERPPAPGSAAAGRRILSTAFVRVGPDSLLTVAMRDGRELVLRNVVMRPADFCGTAVAGGRGKACEPYAEVVAARPGAAPAAPLPDLAAPNSLPVRR
ncbi:hypothetical protein [Sphingomonas sediminicola]|uniref:hypothetical protein n=1 Tax=Sphingomonas sediminicola TaxID=386874 RepID=UPI000DEF5F7F|nr:hypothetical protein ['Sphingomonas ginsengisoli' Hoang et al. 2012]